MDQLDKIPNELLRGHLHRFFGVSVAKGEGLARSAEEQLEMLDSPQAPRNYGLINPEPAVARLKTMSRDSLPEGNIRDFARQEEGSAMNRKLQIAQQMQFQASIG